MMKRLIFVLAITAAAAAAQGTLTTPTTPGCSNDPALVKKNVPLCKEPYTVGVLSSPHYATPRDYYLAEVKEFDEYENKRFGNATTKIGGTTYTFNNSQDNFTISEDGHVELHGSMTMEDAVLARWEEVSK